MSMFDCFLSSALYTYPDFVLTGVHTNSFSHDIGPAMESSHTAQNHSSRTQETFAIQGRERSWLTRLIRVTALIYRNVILLGFHSHYLPALHPNHPDADVPLAPSSHVELDSTTSVTTARQRNDWWKMLEDSVHCFGERSAPLLLNGSAVYMYVLSISLQVQFTTDVAISHSYL